MGFPDLSKPYVAAADVPPERAAAVSEIRAEAAAGDTMPFPNAFQSDRIQRLAERPEPLTMAEVESIQTELALIAKRRAATTDAREIAALEARARELRSLVLRDRGVAMRQ